MRITVRFFALARESVGSASGEHRVPDGTTLADVSDLLFEMHPALREMRLSFAVNSSYAAPATVLHDGDEVACIPPVGGG